MNNDKTNTNISHTRTLTYEKLRKSARTTASRSGDVISHSACDVYAICDHSGFVQRSNALLLQQQQISCKQQQQEHVPMKSN